MINADEIAGILKQQIASFNGAVQEDEVGTVIEVGATLARVYGLRGVRASELVEFPNGLQGVALNLEEDNVGVVIMGDDEDIKEGILKIGIRKLERDIGVSHHTLDKILKGEAVRRKTLAKIVKQLPHYRETNTDAGE